METFIARQPIFDSKQGVYAYEMLYRSGPENVARCTDFDYASAKVISEYCLMLGRETSGRQPKAFINVTGETLHAGIAELLPPEQTVVEVLETVEPDSQTLDALRKLKRAGYLVSLDDFTYRAELEPLIDLADFVKIDFLASNRNERRALARMLRPRGISLVAEKVEDQIAFREALETGYAYFQGFFFCRPQVLSYRDVPGSKLHYLRILGETRRPDPDFARLEEMVKSDVALSYKLLRYINSAAFARRRAVGSIRQALALLGEREFRKWVGLFALAHVAGDKPEELLVQSLVRAKFCESLAARAGLAERADDLLLVGMLSLVDAMLDRPLADILDELALDEEIRSALLLEGEKDALRLVYECVLRYERGEWLELSRSAGALGIEEAALPKLYLKAVEWADAHFRLQTESDVDEKGADEGRKICVRH